MQQGLLQAGSHRQEGADAAEGREVCHSATVRRAVSEEHLSEVQGRSTDNAVSLG